MDINGILYNITNFNIYLNATQTNNNVDIFGLFYYIRIYFLFAVIPIGLLGNFIALLIFTRPNLNKKTNTGFLYSILCVTNIFTIADFVFIEHPQIFLNYSVKLHCNLDKFLQRSLFDLLSWMQVLICFDRYLLVMFPVRSKKMAKKLILFGIILVLCVFISIINSTVFITKTFTSSVGNRTKTTVCLSYSNLDLAMKFVDPLVKIYIPCFIMIVLNIKVVLHLRRSKKRSSAGQANRRNNVNKFAVSTILVDLIFLIFKSPEALLYIYIGIQIFAFDHGFFNVLLDGSKLVTFLIGTFIDFSLTFSIVLFIIFVVFNRLFRQELVSFFSCGRLSSILSNRLNQLSSRLNS